MSYELCLRTSRVVGAAEVDDVSPWETRQIRKEVIARVASHVH
jgi:hypothetical protein